jgi:hypothetical protein
MALPSALIVATAGALDCHRTLVSVFEEPSLYEPVARNATIPPTEVVAARGTIVTRDSATCSLVPVQAASTSKIELQPGEQLSPNLSPYRR